MAEKKNVSESDTIILSLHGRWWRKMLAGEKILEIRKTAPKRKDQEYRVLVYVTGGGGVCGEFTCTDFMKIKMLPELLETHKKQSCLTDGQVMEYAGEGRKSLWGWAVTEVKEYCNPHRGEVERNLQYARELTRIALDNGFAPITPHLYLTQVVNEEAQKEREKGMAAGKEILKQCRYILIGSRYGLSEGMLEEIALAQNCGTVELAQTKGGLVEVYNGGEKP